MTTILPVQDDLAIENQTIAIAGQLLRNLSNEQITNLITKNTVLLDGESIQVLLDRKLGNLLIFKVLNGIHARVVTNHLNKPMA